MCDEDDVVQERGKSDELKAEGDWLQGRNKKHQNQRNADQILPPYSIPGWYCLYDNNHLEGCLIHALFMRLGTTFSAVKSYRPRSDQSVMPIYSAGFGNVASPLSSPQENSFQALLKSCLSPLFGI